MESLVRQYYSLNKEKPLWTSGNSLNKKAKNLLKVLSHASEEGLFPENYHGEILSLIGNHKNKKTSPENIEMLLTDAYIHYAHDLSLGRYSSRPKTIYWKRKDEESDFSSKVLTALETGDPVSRLEDFSPQRSGYGRLKKALAEYRKLSEKGGWPHISSGPKLILGDTGERVSLLRKRLAVTGELRKEGKEETFDNDTEEAVKHFQERHGLDPDGTVGEETLKVLNVPVEDRIRTLEINLERRRWVDRTLGDRHIFVNIPDFRLFAVDGHHTDLMMNVVVGLSREWQTPSLSSEITHLIVNPQWHVPTNIIKKELLAKIQNNPNYIAKERMKAYHVTESGTELIADPASFNWSDASPGALRLVQKEGAGNALGRLKFMFPNPFDIYLHDTPQQKFFARWMRALSHGCIRVEKPLDLAEFVMEPTGMSLEEIEQAIARGTNRSIPLKEPLPLHVLYWTAWVDKDGRVNFRNDIYGKDREVAHALGLN